MNTLPAWLQVLLTSFGLVIALSGWAKVLIDHVSARPKVHGRLINVMKGRIEIAANSFVGTSFMAYVYIVNARKSTVHVFDFELEADRGKGWERLRRFYSLNVLGDSFPFTAPSGEQLLIPLTSTALQATRTVAEFGKPAHGWVLFAGELALLDSTIRRYRLTCIDANGKRHRAVQSPKEFADPQVLGELAQAQIPAGAVVPNS